METSQQAHPPLTEQETQDILAFCEVVRGIVDRLVREGYEIQDGRIVPPRGQMAETQK